MPKFDKPDSPNIIWGVNALDADLTRPDDSYIQTGWTQVKPPYEYENYSMNKLYQGFAYYNQLGFPEWDSVTEYQAGKSYVQASNNRVYKCIQTHTNRNPATAGNESFWERLAITFSNIFSTLFPVGSVVIRPTNPGNSIDSGGLGFGTWQKIEGVGLIGEGSHTDSRGETKSFTRGDTEGTFKHLLTSAEMPSHTHDQQAWAQENSDPTGGNYAVGSDSGGGGSQQQDLTTKSTGGSNAHNNLHPVFAVPIWFRIS